MENSEETEPIEPTTVLEYARSDQRHAHSKFVFALDVATDIAVWILFMDAVCGWVIVFENAFREYRVDLTEFVYMAIGLIFYNFFVVLMTSWIRLGITEQQLQPRSGFWRFAASYVGLGFLVMQVSSHVSGQVHIALLCFLAVWIFGVPLAGWLILLGERIAPKSGFFIDW
ncbi:MAG: hypothetical protein M3O30_05935 [Planctomycetota bacterium]|nr:hypothetical protein [Planctomycetota bacterium]